MRPCAIAPAGTRIWFECGARTAAETLADTASPAAAVTGSIYPNSAKVSERPGGRRAGTCEPGLTVVLASSASNRRLDSAEYSRHPENVMMLEVSFAFTD